MASGRPMIGEIELELVQKIETDEDQVLVQHSVPALEGDFLQRLGRRASRIKLSGVMTGPESAESLKTLRAQFRDGEPTSFVADIATATQVGDVLIEEFGVRELAGKAERFAYELTLREMIPPPAPQTEPPPPVPPVPVPPDVAELEVEVIVEGQPDFDFSKITVMVEGTTESSGDLTSEAGGTNISRTLTNRTGNVWSDEQMPPGQYTATASADDPVMTGSAGVTLGRGERKRVTITLHPGAVIAKAFIVHFWFDKAFVEPCMCEVLQQVARYADAHPNEKLAIIGHADKQGGFPPAAGALDYNQSLSERRARSVYSYLTAGRDRQASLDEWNALRVKRPVGELPSVKDSWGTREYQYILQDLGYYPGNITEIHLPGDQTDTAVRAFQNDNGLTADGIVGDATWAVLIDKYISQDNLAVPESQFFPNARDGCDAGILKWIGASEHDSVRNTQDAWRPNRRVEMLFIAANQITCKVPKPVTFHLPPPAGAGSAWCLDNGSTTSSDFGKQPCFTTRDESSATAEKWLIQPAEPGTFIVSGRITFEDGTPAAGVKYVLIAPDGEFMDGEIPNGANRGKPIKGTTDANGEFSYPDKPKGIGIYTLEIEGPFAVRSQGQPSGAAKGNVVCQRLDGSSALAVVLSTPPRIGRRVQLALLTQETPAAPLVPLSKAWVYWREQNSQTLLRTNEEGLLKSLREGADATQPWEYTEQFITLVETEAELYYNFGAEPIPDEELRERSDIFLPIVVPPPAPAVAHPVEDLRQPLVLTDTGAPPATPSQTSQATLPPRRLLLTKPAELSIWPLLWELPGNVYSTDGLDQGATMWRAAPGDPNGGKPHPVAGSLSLTENSNAPAPSANVRPKERGLKLEGTIDLAATGAVIKLFDTSNNRIALRPNPNATTSVQEVNGTLGIPPNPSDPKPFSATIIPFDAVNAFGRIRVQIESVGLTPPVIESFTVLFCGLQIALVDDHQANANGQQRGSIPTEADEKIIVDFIDSPQNVAATAPQNALISAQSRARRMVAYEFANHERALNPATPAGTGNPAVLKPQMPLWMAELHLVGVNRALLEDLMLRRKQSLTGNPTDLQIVANWNMTLSWDGPDSSTGSGIQTNETISSGSQTITLTLSAANQIDNVDAQSQVVNAISPAPTVPVFPVANRRLPQVVIDGQTRAWGRHSGATTIRTVLIEWQPLLTDVAGIEILRGGDSLLNLTSMTIAGAPIDVGVPPPAATEPAMRLPVFRVLGLNPGTRAHVEGLINSLVEEFFNAHNTLPRITLLTLDIWQQTARSIIFHESLSTSAPVHSFGHQFEFRGAGRRRFGTQYYGHEQDMPVFGPPHGYGFGQLDTPRPSPDQVWSFLENIREAVRRIMEDKAQTAFNHFTVPSTAVSSVAFSGFNLRRRRAMYRREIVRRYNGGTEFRFESGSWRVHTTVSPDRQEYPNVVLGTNVVYPGPTNFTEADFGPGI